MKCSVVRSRCWDELWRRFVSERHSGSDRALRMAIMYLVVRYHYPTEFILHD